MSRRRPLPLASVASMTILVVFAVLGAFPPGARADASAATCAPNSGTASISGTVTGPGATPQNSVLVTAYTSYGKQAGSAYTNASGAYTISNLIGGNYILQFRPGTGNLQGEWYTNQSSALTATPVLVNTASAVININAQLDPGAQISGNVTGAGSGPLQYIDVSVYDSSGNQVASGSTDAAGNYLTRPGLPSGSYRVRFDGDNTYLGSYYSNQPSLETATPLTLTSPNVLANINATLARGGQITGQVRDATTNAPLSGMYVNASSDTGSGYDYTDASGNFSIGGLPSGTYTLRAQPLFDDINLIGAESTATVTAPATTTGVVLTMSPGGTITGRVTKAGGTPLNSVTVYVGSNDADYGNYVTTNASGVYTATALPSGHYFLQFRPSNLIEEVYNDHPLQGEQRDLVTVTAPATVTGIDAELAEGASISGTVTDAATNAPIKDIFVEVLDVDGRRVETAFTQADGSYQIPPKLPPGNYKVRFNADERFASCAYVTEYYNDKFTVESADLVAVSGPGNIPNINAGMTRGSNMFGRVTDAVTGAPITSGSVLIYDAAGKLVQFGRLTMTGGWYNETALASGQYYIKFRDYDSGYIDEYYNDKPTLEAADPVTVTAPTDVTGIDAALAKGAQISGRVTTADTGQPFTYGSVIVYTSGGEEVGYSSIAADGTYTVTDGLATGSYIVGVIPYDFEGQGLAGKVSMVEPQGVPLDQAQLGYAPTFYGGKVTSTASTPVSVTAPGTTTGIDIAMLHGIWLPLTPH